MEAYSSSYSSPKSSSYSSQNSEEAKAKGLKRVYPLKSHDSFLHSVRKSAAKPWKKAPIAPPMPPTPFKIYKVDAINFKDLVQHLTCAPEFKPPHPHHQLLQSNQHSAALNSLDVPSPTMENLSSGDISTASPPVCTDNWYQYLKAEGFGKNSQDGAMTPAGFPEMNLFSPTSLGNWCNFYPSIMSPRA